MADATMASTSTSGAGPDPAPPLAASPGAPAGLWARLQAAFAHAFSTEPEPLDAEDAAFLDELARRCAERRLTVPALLAAEGVRATPGLSLFVYGALPLAELCAPFLSLGLVKTPEEVRRLARLSERREHMAALAQRIEAHA